MNGVTVTGGKITTGFGGGIYNTNGTVNLRSTIVAENTAAGAIGSPDFLSAVSTTSSFNLIGNNRGATGITNGTNNNQVGTSTNPIEALLAPLGN